MIQQSDPYRPTSRMTYCVRQWLSILTVLLLTTIQPVHALHHMKLKPVPWNNVEDSSRLFKVTNLCNADIYPAIETQGGTGPSQTGFLAVPGNTTNFTVSPDWQGRVWARTNCTFNSNGTGPAQTGGIEGNGRACMTGDCGGVLQCNGTGDPATLAEFTLSTNMSLSFYDISLVDGYNLPISIVSLHPLSNPSALPPNETNPVCIGTPSFLDTATASSQNVTTNHTTYSIPLESSLSTQSVSRWCPWDLQIFPPPKPGAGVYPYPDDNIARPDFDPCLSMCSMYGDPADCCTGDYDSSSSCGPNLYSTAAKSVCPDAYSYAYDDKSSTFAVQQGSGFEIVFCPYGRSTNIRQTVTAQQQGNGGSTSGAVSGYETPKWLSLRGENSRGRYSTVFVLLVGYVTVGLLI